MAIKFIIWSNGNLKGDSKETCNITHIFYMTQFFFIKKIKIKMKGPNVFTGQNHKLFLSVTRFRITSSGMSERVDQDLLNF